MKKHINRDILIIPIILIGLVVWILVQNIDEEPVSTIEPIEETVEQQATTEAVAKPSPLIDEPHVAISTSFDAIKPLTQEEATEEPPEDPDKSLLYPGYDRHWYPDFKPLDIKFDIKYQQYLYDLCVDFGIDFKLMISIIWRESTFNPNAKSAINKEGYRAYGLVQMYGKYLNYEIRRFGLDKHDFDVYNPYHAMLYLVLRVNDDRDYWINKDISGDHLIYCILGSYNYGREGYEAYFVNKDRWTYKYINDILEYRDNLTYLQ